MIRLNHVDCRVPQSPAPIVHGRIRNGHKQAGRYPQMEAFAKQERRSSSPTSPNRGSENAGDVVSNVVHHRLLDGCSSASSEMQRCARPGSCSGAVKFHSLRSRPTSPLRSKVKISTFKGRILRSDFLLSSNRPVKKIPLRADRRSAEPGHCESGKNSATTLDRIWITKNRWRASAGFLSSTERQIFFAERPLPNQV